ncbi:hypothetical protein JCM10212_004301 [Sporobolomyces blumeae]
MLRSSVPPHLASKRPLTESFSASKRNADDVTTKKRKLSGSAAHLEPVDKENWSGEEPAQDDDGRKGEAMPLVPAQESISIVATTPQEPPSTPTTPTPSQTSSSQIPHVFAHANLVLSTSSPLTSSLPLSGRSDQRDTLLAFLTRRFPSVYAPTEAPASNEGPSSSSSSSSSSLEPKPEPRFHPRGPGPAALYASGPPGIGKTALLASVLGDFTRNVADRHLSDDVKVCMRNCSTVGSGDTAWERLAEGLGIGSPRDRNLKPKERFEQGLRDGRKYLLVLDEIDHLCSPSTSTSPSRASSAPDLLNALFSLVSLPSSPLTLIGIANDLTLKALNLNSVPSPIKMFGLKGKAKLDPLTTPTKPINLHFAPYTWQELVRIVSQRLELLVADPSTSYPLDLTDLATPLSDLTSTTTTTTPLPKTFPLIDKVALERAAKKVATGTGDVRTVLDLVRKSISLVSASYPGSTSSPPPRPIEDLTASTAPKATMRHMTLALSTSTGMSTAPSLSSRLASLNPSQRFVLVSLVVALSRQVPLGLEERTDHAALSRASVSLEEAYKVYRDVVGREDNLRSVLVPTKETFGETVEMVEDLGGFVVVSSGLNRSRSASSSPTKGRAGAGAGAGAAGRKTPSPTKAPRGPKGGGKSIMHVALSSSTPLFDLVSTLLPSLTSPTSTSASPTSTELEGSPGEKLDEPTRLIRKILARELSDQRWKRKLVEMGRDEDRRAEMELEGREWERKLKAQANERGDAC